MTAKVNPWLTLGNYSVDQIKVLFNEYVENLDLEKLFIQLLVIKINKKKSGPANSSWDFKKLKLTQ